MLLRVLSSVAVGALPLLIVAWLWRRISRRRHVPVRLAVYVAIGGVAAGAFAMYVERLVLGWTDLGFEAARVGEAGALMATFLLAAPLEEALKVLVVWPMYRTRHISGPRLGLAYAATAAAGFACAEAVWAMWAGPGSALALAREALGAPAHLFFAGMWGYALGSGRQSRGRWFSVAWLSAMLLHGLYDHIVFGRGPGFLVVALPMLGAMGMFAWIALRDVAPRPDSSGPFSGPLSGRVLATLPEPPSLRAMRRSLERSDRPLMLHWIAIGTLVTMGVMIAMIALAVFAGHRIGIDFAMADEADVRSSGPLVLIGSAILSAFPIAGYLVARASAATSVLEPAMGAGLAIAAVLAMLSVTAPIAVVFALAVAPVAFALACGGAWFGLGGH
jgi:hypothetical protein